MLDLPKSNPKRKRQSKHNNVVLRRPLSGLSKGNLYIAKRAPIRSASLSLWPRALKNCLRYYLVAWFAPRPNDFFFCHSSNVS